MQHIRREQKQKRCLLPPLLPIPRLRAAHLRVRLGKSAFNEGEEGEKDGECQAGKDAQGGRYAEAGYERWEGEREGDAADGGSWTVSIGFARSRRCQECKI